MGEKVSLKEVRAQVEKRLGRDRGSLDEHKAKFKELVGEELKKLNEKKAENDQSATQVTPKKKSQAQDMTRKRFMERAEPLEFQIGSKKIKLAAKEFASRNVGFHGQGKFEMVVDGVPLTCQANFIITMHHSKEWTRGE